MRKQTDPKVYILMVLLIIAIIVVFGLLYWGMNKDSYGVGSAVEGIITSFSPFSR